ncbi:MAG: ABC transporter ATP-binding protein [Chloroflexi bacterium]|nr:ABC transporter ATP-binding protein [Chloroflexota bacterium]
MLTVKGLHKKFQLSQAEHGAVQALQGISFEVAEGEFFTLLGPSGCGKTTALRCVGGLERPDAGEILISGQRVFSSDRGSFVPCYKRDIAMVFQSYAIWPHMSVFDNVAYPLRYGQRHGTSKLSAPEVTERVQDALTKVRMLGMEKRPATDLSGGQQQRVALARALVRQAKLMLLDEPLSNLDAKLREEMRWEIRELVKEVGLTAVYVTHDQAEALVMSDRVAVMRQGQVVQCGPPRDMYLRPENEFVAAFVGSINRIPGTLADEGSASGTVRVATALGAMLAQAREELQKERNVVLAIRPENVTVSQEEPIGSRANILRGTVSRTLFAGDYLDCSVVLDNGQPFRARLHPLQEIAVGARVYLSFEPNLCVIVPALESQ